MDVRCSCFIFLFGHLILSKINKIVAPSCQISRLKCPIHRWGAHSAPPDPVQKTPDLVRKFAFTNNNRTVNNYLSNADASRI